MSIIPAATARESGRVVMDDDLPDVAGWTADQIATSPIFGLDTTRDSRGERALQTEQRLLSKTEALSEEERERLHDAKQLLDGADGPATAAVRELLQKAAASEDV